MVTAFAMRIVRGAHHFTPNNCWRWLTRLTAAEEPLEIILRRYERTSTPALVSITELPSAFIRRIVRGFRPGVQP